MLDEIFLNTVVAEALMPGLGKVTVGGCVGYALGFAIKKTLKLVMIFLGLFTVLAIILANQNMITINWDIIATNFQELIDKHGVLSIEQLGEHLGAFIPLTGGLVAGFVFGFRQG
jgi:uncharacterized membrane protein (Fun14 family)